MHENNEDLSWKKLLEFRNMQEKLEINLISTIQTKKKSEAKCIRLYEFIF